MKRDDAEFMERISQDLEARRTACKILGVEETADKQELKRAYRRVAMEFHPDKNQDDPEANRKFAIVKCAYELLAEDKLCPELLEEINSWPGIPEDDKYDLGNRWGHFLWWREKFFG
ncbi:MAG: DnaJ domain-containing protein [Sedimentisphaerales bacterium]|nr:DnaJ domain-containing protein [Sedimentisphaerales bacterium]